MDFGPFPNIYIEKSNQCNQSTTETLKSLSKRGIQKTAEVVGDLNGNQTVSKITKMSKT